MSFATITQSGVIKEIQKQGKKTVVRLEVEKDKPCILVDVYGKLQEKLVAEVILDGDKIVPVIFSGNLNCQDNVMTISANDYCFGATRAVISCITVCGFMGRDPSTHYFESGAGLTEGALAVNVYKQDRPAWFNFKAWNKLGDIIGNYTKKGSMVAIVGKLNIETWMKDDVQQGKHLVNVDNVFLMPRNMMKQNNNNNNNNSSNNNSNGYTNKEEPAKVAFTLSATNASDDDIPF